MGQVFLARHLDRPNTTVVVKMMKPHIAAQPKLCDMFRDEIRSMARLRHPYLVSLLDASFNDPAGPFLVMEYAPGITLQALLAKEKHLSPGHTGLILGCLCQALEAAQSIGMVHRDLKPANLMIIEAGTEQESLRVMDFGFALLNDRPHLSLEKLSGAKRLPTQGTPAYISPEALRGDSIDTRADIYSTGVILYEMLTGCGPFPYASNDQLLWAHVNQRPQSFADVGAGHLPPKLERVVHRCLEKYPVERPASPRELAELYSEAIDIDVWEATLPPEWKAPPPLLAEAAAPPLARPADANTLIRDFDAWMPESIAIIKVRGFVEDHTGQILSSEAGRIRIRLGKVPSLRNGFLLSKPKEEPVEVDLYMERPNPRENELHLTVHFRPPHGYYPPDKSLWHARCGEIYNSLRSYLMARS